MRTSHREIKRRINNETANITDKELFSSSAFSAYLTDMAETVSGRYNRKMRVSCFWDTSESAFIANTDNKVIRINTGNFITRSFPTRVLKADSIIGLAAHELGHILYTSFELNNLCINKMRSGLLYPKELEIENTFDMINAEEYKNMLSGSDKLYQNALITIFHNIVNILEDKYIEEKMSNKYSGRFAKGIMLNNIRYSEIIPSVSEQIKSKAYNFSILANMFIQYCKIGDINNRDDYDGEIMGIFLDCVPEIDNAVQDEDMRERFNCANIIMVKAWKYVKEILENVKEEEENGGYTEKTLENDLNEQIASYIGIPDADYSPVDEKKADRTHERIKLKKTENFSSDGSGNVSINNDYEGSETSKERKIDCILTEIAEEKVLLQTEMELTEELQKEADRIDYGNAHKDIDIVINRLSYIPEKYVEDYNAFAKPLLYLSKQLQKQTARFLNDRHFYGKISGLLMGRRIEPRLLNNKEGRIFSKKGAEEKRIDMAVTLLVDESGSMYGERITSAMAAAVVIYDFCKAMDIPLMILGHTDDSKVEIYMYTDFDSYKDDDKYRIMDMCARNGNRDGAALRFAAERLYKRPENSKLLMLISDGQPAGSGNYNGTAAEADLRGIVKEYKNKKIMFMAAAIGEDKENIERIYKDTFFDISDITKLPFLLAKRIQKELKNI